MLKREEAVELLKAGVNRLSSEQGFKEWLDFARTIKSYSLHNRFLIMLQCPDASIVGGMRNFWNVHQRWVRKGEKGIAILAPMILTKKDAATWEEQKLVTRFRPVPVFDVKQTEGAPLPASPKPVKLSEEAPADFFDALSYHVTSSGLTLTRQPAHGEENGFYEPLAKRINLNPDLSGAQALKTLAHEVAHWKLHSDEKGRQIPREIAETEAEAAAYLALHELGIDSAAYSFAYLAGWTAGNVQAIERSMARIRPGDP